MKTFDPHKRISIEKYNREYEIAEQQIADGDVFTQEEVIEIIKSWRRKSHEA